MKRLTKIIIKVCKYLNNNVSFHPIKYYGASRKVFNFKDLNQINRLGIYYGGLAAITKQTRKTSEGIYPQKEIK